MLLVLLQRLQEDQAQGRTHGWEKKEEKEKYK